MGNVCERLIHSVKNVVEKAYSDGKLLQTGLKILVVGVERLVKSRPLTHLPLDSLLGRSEERKQSVSIEVSRPKLLTALREQMQKHVFCKRWLVKYLPVICRQLKRFH